MTLRRLLLVVLILLLAALGWWSGARSAGEASGPAVPLASAAASAVALTSAPEASAVEVQTLAPASAPSMTPERHWAERDRAWCEARTEYRRASSGEGDPAHFAALEQTRRQNTVDLLGEWERQLRARIDPESQAEAEVLWLIAQGRGDGGRALSRLQELSERSSSTYLAGLAAQWSCKHGAPACQSLARRWRELAPDNLAALALNPADIYAAPYVNQPAKGHASALIERLMASQSLQDPTKRLLQRLWTLENQAGASTRRYIALEALTGVDSDREILLPLRLMFDCRDGDESLKAQCGRLADQLWPMLTETQLQQIALRTARPQPGNAELWEERASRWEAGRQWEEDQLRGRDAGKQDPLCESATALMRDALLIGEVATLHRRMPRDPAEQRRFSERFRQRNKGRSVLADL